MRYGAYDTWYETKQHEERGKKYDEDEEEEEEKNVDSVENAVLNTEENGKSIFHNNIIIYDEHRAYVDMAEYCWWSTAQTICVCSVSSPLFLYLHTSSKNILICWQKWCVRCVGVWL